MSGSAGTQSIPKLGIAAVPALRQAQGERYYTARGEPFDAAQDRLVEPQRCIPGCALAEGHKEGPARCR
jgi:hypothetical protein